MTDESETMAGEQRTTVATVFLTFLRLGFTSFGGPVAHIGYFHEEFVVRRKWLDEHAYADLVALYQFLPEPASSQVGIGVGLSRAGLPGAVAAWFAFTMPSAIALILFGYGALAFGDAVGSGALHGLKVVAVAVVAQAVWTMARDPVPRCAARNTGGAGNHCSAGSALSFRTGGSDYNRWPGWLGHPAHRCADGACRYRRPR